MTPGRLKDPGAGHGVQGDPATALARAESLSFTPEGVLACLNRVRSVGKLKVNEEDPMSVKEVADENEKHS